MQQDSSVRSTYEKLQEAQGKTWLGPLPLIGWVAFYGFLFANRSEAAKAVGLDPASVLYQVLLLIGLGFTGSLAMSVSSVLCHSYTGIVYTEDRKAFALAGGFDIGRVPMLLVQAGVFFLYWYTVSLNPDPLASIRHPVIVLVLASGGGLLLTGLTGWIFYSQQEPHNAGGW